MKKRIYQNPLKEKAKQIADLLNIEEKKYLPEFELLKIEVEKISETKSKISFWESAKQQYLDTISNASFATSGVISFYIPNKELFLDRLISNEIEKLKTLPPQQTETETEQETENDFTLSTIEDWLFEFKEKMNETDYQTLVSALKQYFDTGTFPILSKPIQINGRPNKKLFGWALNRIFEAKGKGIEKELLQFAKQNISLFTNVQFDETNILKSNLYKYFTTQTK
jgi:hypothetical protein